MIETKILDTLEQGFNLCERHVSVQQGLIDKKKALIKKSRGFIEDCRNGNIEVNDTTIDFLEECLKAVR